MKIKKVTFHVVRFFFAMIIGVFVASFASGVSTVQASQMTQEVTIADENAPLASEADNAGSSVFLLMGGMLLIILTVVITVVATFVVTAPIADEI